MCAHQQQYYDAITASSNAANSGPFIDFIRNFIRNFIRKYLYKISLMSFERF